jgi:hypothetical protein
MVGAGEEERIIIAFGFNEKVSAPSNAVYEYSVAKNRLAVLFEGTKVGSESNSPSIQPFHARGRGVRLLLTTPASTSSAGRANLRV